MTEDNPSTSILQSLRNRKLNQTQYNMLRDVVLCDKKFGVWPAGLRHHHTKRGDLFVHTREVLDLCLEIGRHCCADLEVLEIAALWHDFGKTEEYIKEDHSVPAMKFRGADVWTRDPNKNHIVIGRDKFEQVANQLDVPYDFISRVMHCIAAHHGRVTWGALEEPKTLEAEILHYANMLSMRMWMAVNQKDWRTG